MIAKYLDCSSTHITEQTFNQLVDEEIISVTSHKKETDGILYGVFVHVPDKLDQEDDVPDDLADMFDYARAMDCYWIIFDVEGEIIDTLHVYD